MSRNLATDRVKDEKLYPKWFGNSFEKSSITNLPVGIGLSKKRRSPLNHHSKSFELKFLQFLRFCIFRIG